jgi:hypothetical protein
MRCVSKETAVQCWELVGDFVKISLESGLYIRRAARTPTDTAVLITDSRDVLTIADIGDYLIVSEFGTPKIIMPFEFHDRFRIIEEDVYGQECAASTG